MGNSPPTHLDPSELGTKEYWDTTYKSELTDDVSPQSELTGWFSDVNASTKIIKYLSSSTSVLGLDKSTTSFLDLGTGNGELLFRLHEEGGFKGGMLGVDYSQASVDLCRKLAEAKDLAGNVDFETWDIMNDGPSKCLGSRQQGWDVVLDKGTFDAVSLSAEVDKHGRRVCEGYRDQVECVIKDGGLLLVTSCNWTEAELRKWFETPQGLQAIGKIEYRVFSFGGQSGQSVCSVCFRKRRKDELSNDH